jgi:CRP-like cAMP-binding protein
MKKASFLNRLFTRAGSHGASSPMVEILKENILFQTLDDTEFTYLSQFIYERVYQAGEPVFRQNERGLGMYMIAQGRVEIHSPAAEGNVKLTSLGAKSFFGEMALIQNDDVRTASAVAVEPTVLYGLFKPDLMAVLEARPQMGVKILLQMSIVLARRLMETSSKVIALPQSKMANTG